MTRAIAAALCAGLLAPAAATAQDTDSLVGFQSLRPELALELAQATMEACREGGYQVGVAVVDRAGTLQAFVRDRYAGAHTVETATRKAWTAVSFRSDTLTLDQNTRPDTTAAAIRHITMALPLGGGVPVEAAGSLVGGVGVSGAPGPDIDDECARAGISAIEDQLAF